MGYIDQDIWKNDSITRSYKKEQGEVLNKPSRMSLSRLANTCTYCNNWDNPYAREIVKRSGLTEKYNSTRGREKKRKIFEKACAGFGIKMY